VNSVRKITLLLVVALSLTVAVGVAHAQIIDSGTVDVQVTNNNQSQVDKQTAKGAFISYFGDGDTTFGSSGTGVFDPFVRLQGSPTEQGYNTNGATQFDTKVGTWTHAILVSQIPQRPCPTVATVPPVTVGSLTCFELFVDINDSNGASSFISLNKVEVYFTSNANLTGYNFTGSAALQYAFSGNVLIHDVNQGSGRADLRYDIPITGTNGVPLPPNCNYGNSACTTYFVLYSQWGTSTGAHDYSSDGGFEEWKVKIYPAITLTKTPSPTDVCSSANTQVTYTYVVKNTGQSVVSGTVVDDNGTPGNPADDVTIGTFTNLAVGASQTFTHVFTVNATTTNIAKATATDSNGATAEATATATVTAHPCNISLTKKASVTDVCNDKNTSVTYTYVVTNNSDLFKVSGSLTDDQFGSIGSFGPIAPGASQTLTKTATVNGTVKNTATASGTFDDSKPTSASAQASVTVTGHTCTISLTKTPSTKDVCNDKNTSVTYTYVVKNTGDFFNVSGNVTDDKISGGIGSFGPLAPGASATLTKAATVNATVTNTATATGTFDDSNKTTASATATATVTGHECSITLTKAPSVTDVCNGSNTSVTYTYVVTNNSDLFSFSGTLTDNKIAGSVAIGPLAAGKSQTLTKVGTVNGTVINTGTATGTFADSTGTTATATATATVTGHNCTISLTKTPSITTVCTGSNTPVTYTYVVKNTGDFFNVVSGSLTDSVYGSIGSFGPLAPGASQTLTKTANVNATVTNVGTATATFNDSKPATATATATATVTGISCAQITPTNTTCSDFKSGTAATLTEVLYGVKSGVINNVAPGVFFYWNAVSAAVGSNTFTINEAITTNNFDSHFFSVAAGSNAFNASCTSLGATITQVDPVTGKVTVTFNAASAGTVFLGIKFSTGDVVGFPTPSPTTVHYAFDTGGQGPAGLDLKQK
jgi:hypothetical protein